MMSHPFASVVPRVPSNSSGSGTTATAATMAIPVRYSHADSSWRAVFVNTK